MKDKEIIKELRKGNTKVFREVYNCFPMIRKMVLKNSGDEEDAKDIFQNALIVFYKNVQKPEFELTSKISSYLYAICDKSWKKQLTRDKSRQHASIHDDAHESIEAEEAKIQPTKSLKEVIVELLEAIGEPCKTLLMLHEYQKISMQEIAEKMGYANAHSARNQKYKCIEKLKKQVNPELRALYL